MPLSTEAGIIVNVSQPHPAYVSKTTMVITISLDQNDDGVVDSSFTITRTIA